MTQQLLESIRSVELFSDLGQSSLDALANVMTVKDVDDQGWLFREGEKRNELFVVLTGQIELTKTKVNGEHQRLYVFSAGQFLGEGVLLDDYPHSTNARAVGATELLTLTRDAYQTFLGQHPHAL